MLLFPLPLVLEMGITVPPPAAEVGATELLLVALVPTGGTKLLLFAVALAWEMAALLETGTAVLLTVALPAELLLEWKFVVLPLVGKTVAWEEMGVWVLLPVVVLEIVMFGAVVMGVVVVSVAVLVVVM